MPLSAPEVSASPKLSPLTLIAAPWDDSDFEEADLEQFKVGDAIQVAWNADGAFGVKSRREVLGHFGGVKNGALILFLHTTNCNKEDDLAYSRFFFVRVDDNTFMSECSVRRPQPPGTNVFADFEAQESAKRLECKETQQRIRELRSTGTEDQDIAICLGIPVEYVKLHLNTLL